MYGTVHPGLYCTVLYSITLCTMPVQRIYQCVNCWTRNRTDAVMQSGLLPISHRSSTYVIVCTKCCCDWCLQGYTKQQAVTWCPTRDQPEGRKHFRKNFITFKLLQNETFCISSHLCKNKVMFRKTFQENTKVNIFVPPLLGISVANIRPQQSASQLY